jgi:hypothetical protein
VKTQTELLRAALYLCNALPNTAPRGFEDVTGFPNSYALASAIEERISDEGKRGVPPREEAADAERRPEAKGRVTGRAGGPQ